MPVVPNGGFETGTLSPWTAVPAAAVSVTSLFPHSGIYAAQMTASTLGSAVTLTSTTIGPLVSGTTFMVEFSLLWYVDYRQAQTFSLYGTWGSATTPAITTFSLPVVANWGLDQYSTYYTSAVTVPLLATQLSVAFELDAGNQPVSVMVDDVQVIGITG